MASSCNTMKRIPKCNEIPPSFNYFIEVIYPDGTKVHLWQSFKLVRRKFIWHIMVQSSKSSLEYQKGNQLGEMLLFLKKQEALSLLFSF